MAVTLFLFHSHCGPSASPSARLNSQKPSALRNFSLRPKWKFPFVVFEVSSWKEDEDDKKAAGRKKRRSLLKNDSPLLCSALILGPSCIDCAVVVVFERRRVRFSSALTYGGVFHLRKDRKARRRAECGGLQIRRKELPEISR